jgi:hypothetical protein
MFPLTTIPGVFAPTPRVSLFRSAFFQANNDIEKAITTRNQSEPSPRIGMNPVHGIFSWHFITLA